ncbi:MAG: S-layer homology domain-containing protein [Halanaerobiales bacterium]
MNKKFSFVIALLLVFAFAMPTSAAVFTDVEEDHWAYEAVNQLVAAGVVEGYPDGTFKGDENMSRFEVAQAVNRALERVAEEREVLESELDSSKEEFTDSQETELEDIVKSIVEKNVPEEEVLTKEEYEQKEKEKEEEEKEKEEEEKEEGLTEKEYEQIANLIEALTFQYKAEIQSLGGRIDDVEDLIDSNQEELEERIADLESDMNTVSFSGEYSVDYTDLKVEGDGTPFVDPYNSEDDDDDDEFDADDEFLHSLSLDTAIEHGPLSADFSMVAAEDVFDGSYDNTDFELTELSGHISGNGFDAWIEETQALEMKPYLFDGSEDDDDDPEYPVNGVIVDAFDNTYALSDDDNTVMAGTEEMDLLGQTFNFAFGSEGELETDTNRVIGVDTEMDLVGFEVTPEFAVSNSNFDDRYFTLNATGEVGPVDTTYNLDMIEDSFEAIKADVSESKGHDVLGEMSLGMVDLSAYYESYEEFNNPYTELEAEITEDNAMNLVGFDVFADVAYYNYLDVSDATRFAYNTTAKNEMGDLTLKGLLNKEYISSEFETEYDDTDTYEETDDFDKTAYAGYDLTDAINASAEMVFDIDNELTQTYAVDYEKGIVTAGLESVIADSTTTTLTAAVDPEAYDVMSVSLDPYADFGMEMADETSMNYALGFDANKALNEYATMTGGFEFADKEFDVDNSGRKLVYDLGVEYEVSEDVSADAKYEVLDFNGEDSDDSYKAEKATAGVSVSF